jgi:hypothetical protein
MLQLFSRGSCTPGDLYRTRTRTQALFSVNSSANPYWPPGKSVNSTQPSAVRREIDWSAASARLLFDEDDAILRKRVRNPYRRVHRSQFAAAVLLLCGRTFSKSQQEIPAIQEMRWSGAGLIKKHNCSLYYSGSSSKTGQAGTGFMLLEKIHHNVIGF